MVPCGASANCSRDSPLRPSSMSTTFHPWSSGGAAEIARYDARRTLLGLGVGLGVGLGLGLGLARYDARRT